jgi:two-component system, chemotaxis family, sensor kinase CheA
MSVDLDLLSDFLAEAGELLDGVDRKLVELEGAPDDKALLNEIFRGFHTVKGGAGFLEATALVDVCHRTESLFDGLRAGKRTLSAEMLDVILRATAVVRRMFDELHATATASPAEPSLLADLDAWVKGDQPAAKPAAPAERPGACAPAARPEAKDASPGEPDWAALLAALLGRPGSASANDEAPAPAAGDPNAHGTAPARARAPGATKAVAETSLRIDIARFDRILNLSGEIGLTKNRIVRLRNDLVSRLQGQPGIKELDQVVSALSMLVSDLQNTVMKARMQPVGRVFQKYLRLARDLGRQLGKEVELAIVGEDTEIDKNMLEELNDPIVHLVRNAVDHGVDSPEERKARGKPAKATIRLEARQIGDAIRIEIVDDGRGMDPAVLRQKAVEKGLLGAEEAAAMDDREALKLIFLPGFSTKAAVSDVSGRGVGMDVVRNNVQRLSGRIDIRSEIGRGTRIAIDLPLTLAILPVLMFRVQSQPYAVPLAIVRGIIRIEPDAVQLVSGRRCLSLRGEVMPVVDVAAALERPGDGGSVGILCHLGAQSLVLAVDSFVGQDEVVIKAFEGFKPKGVAGATLASDGTLVLVLDLSELLQDRGLAIAA